MWRSRESQRVIYQQLNMFNISDHSCTLVRVTCSYRICLDLSSGVLVVAETRRCLHSVSLEFQFPIRRLAPRRELHYYTQLNNSKNKLHCVGTCSSIESETEYPNRYGFVSVSHQICSIQQLFAHIQTVFANASSFPAYQKEGIKTHCCYHRRNFNFLLGGLYFFF